MQGLAAVYLYVIDGIGILPYPPFQRLQVDSDWLVLDISLGTALFSHHFTNTRAAGREQHAGGASFWQQVTLRPSSGIEVWGPSAVATFKRLLDNHPAQQLVIQGSPTVPLYFVDENEASEADMAQAEAMLRSRITC